MRAPVMCCRGTGKSYIINTITAMVRRLTGCNDTVKVAAPSGSAAFNAKGSTIHWLLNMTVESPAEELPVKSKKRPRKQLDRLLVLIID